MAQVETTFSPSGYFDSELPTGNRGPFIRHLIEVEAFDLVLPCLFFLSLLALMLHLQSGMGGETAL
jgi:hypothetical protein